LGSGPHTPALDLRWKAGADVALLCELLHAALDDFEPVAIHDADAGDGLRVFFKSSAARDRAVAALAEAFAADLAALAAIDVADEEWARRSQAGLRAIQVGRLTIAPPWDVPADAAGVIIIDPSTGFGTGHHETTRLCLALLQDIDLAGRRVLDVGTGSGVLAISAARLGGVEAVGIDDYPDALRNAAENIALNAQRAVSLVESDLARFEGSPADVVTANLTGAVLVRHAARLAALVAPGGRLIASGFSGNERDGVAKAFGGTLVRHMDEGDWTAVVLTFPDTRS
jgi:ribosomal protein L11 methyltransferase